MNTILIEAIVAYDNKKGISKNGSLPWSIKEEMNFFTKMTINNIVIMGSNTFNSIPEKYRPLKNRLNIVLTTKYLEYREKYNNIDNLIFTKDEDYYMHILENPTYFTKKYSYLNNNSNFKIFVIGGNSLYKLYIPICTTIWVSKIENNYDCDLHLSIDLDNDSFINEIYDVSNNFFTIYKYTNTFNLTN